MRAVRVLRALVSVPLSVIQDFTGHIVDDHVPLVEIA
jgi:hypothetical protein